MTNNRKDNATPLVALEIDKTGRVSTKIMELDRQATLENTLLQSLYPGIHVATVDVPQEPLGSFEQAQVEQALVRIEFDGVRYSLIGATGSAKNGKFYAVDAAHEKRIAERFRCSLQSAITYFGILVSSCKVRIEEPECRVLVVEDHEFGTNDCRGWISQLLFRKLNLPAHRFYQFRLAFDKTQAKGSFKVMADDVAEKLEADIILPKSAVKPEYKGSLLRSFRSLLGDQQAHGYHGPIVLGIRDVSRDLQFKSSYTLVEHAPADSIELEIKSYALQQIEKLEAAVKDGDFTELFRLLGTSDAQRSIEANEEAAPEYTSVENTVVEAVLKADPTGYIVRHPFINRQLQRLLAKWAFKLCTSGGFLMPGFTLADDGYLLLRDGEVFWGSDWIPTKGAMMSLRCRAGLLVRYPIRMKEDLLPIMNLSTHEAVNLLNEHLRNSGCEMTEPEVLDLFEQQLRLKGTLTLHSETAKRNGGDYDFDQVCVVEGDRFPRFVQDRFAYREQKFNPKHKLEKKQSPWWNLPQVAMTARGNRIGSITDLKTSCLAAGRPDFANQLVDELQNAIDQLKWGTEPDHKMIGEMRKQVTTAPWLKLKNKRRISDMPEHLNVLETDKIGKMYEFLRQHLNRFFLETAPLSDFRGLIAGEPFTREIYSECGIMSTFYAVNIGLVAERRTKLEKALEEAQAEFEARKNDPAARKEVTFKRNQASAELHFFEERSRKDVKNLILMIRMWAQQKNGNRLAYLAALHAIACKRATTCKDEDKRGTGSIVFYAFPQELVNKIVERTGGRPITVAVPELCDGKVEIYPEGRVFLVAAFPNGDGKLHDRHILQMQVTEKGEVFMDRDGSGNPVLVDRVHPFPIQPGTSEVRDGKVVFPGTQQRPFVPKRGTRN
ncbi:MAG: hypothetical protein ACYDA9_20400 [Terriglobia bacterium]